MELEVLKIWPDWKATRLLGEGSFGKVYEIVRNNFGIEEHCALKVISIPSSSAELQSMKNEGMDDESATAYYKGLVEEFVQEIALMSKLKGNVNIVGYEDYSVIERKDTIGWDIIIRMELLTTLPDYIRKNSFSINDVIKLAEGVCSALEVCHESKIIHRDIKPDNIFVSANGDFKLGDFGVARTIEKTVSGLSKKGTYTYMAPEVYKGEAYGTNVDIYSLGIVMYKLLNNNREPFLPPHPELIKYSDKNNALVKRLSGEIIPPPSNSNDMLNRIILKACSFNSKDRYSSPSEMKTELQALKNNQTINDIPVIASDHISAAVTHKTGQSVSVASAPIATSNTAPVNTASTPRNNTVKTSMPAQPMRYDPMTGAPIVRESDAKSSTVSSTNATVNPAVQKSDTSNVSGRTTDNDATVGMFTGNTVPTAKSAIQQPPIQQPPIQQPQQTGGRVKRLTAPIIMGWIGSVIWFLALISTYSIFILIAFIAMICMIFLSIKKLGRARRVFAIIMLVFSACSFNFVNVIAAIMFLRRLS